MRFHTQNRTRDSRQCVYVSNMKFVASIRTLTQERKWLSCIAIQKWQTCKQRREKRGTLFQSSRYGYSRSEVGKLLFVWPFIPGANRSSKFMGWYCSDFSPSAQRRRQSLAAVDAACAPTNIPIMSGTSALGMSTSLGALTRTAAVSRSLPGELLHVVFLEHRLSSSSMYRLELCSFESSLGGF
jgi:hypothetical protein